MGTTEKEIHLRSSKINETRVSSIDFNYKFFSRAKLLLQQNYRCAGCGMKMNNLYAERSRICHYYNRVFCQCCHQGAKTMIPARILHQWNFKYVS